MALTDWRSLYQDRFENKNVLVTGGAGFIGSHLSETLLRLGASVWILDDYSGGDPANVAMLSEQYPSRVVMIEGTITDPSHVAQAAEPCTLIFHQAALGSVPRSVKHAEKYHHVNTTGTLNILESAVKLGIDRVVFAASSSAYGDSETLPKVETMPVKPLSPYAANKVGCEALMRAYASCYDIDTASLRYFNIFGPRQNANSAYAAVIAAFAKALQAKQPPIIFGDGEQSRDFTFVENAVHANLLAATCSRPLNGEVMNVACGQRVTVNELWHRMAAMWPGDGQEPGYQDVRAGDVKHSLADIELARELTGYEPVVSFERGLEATVAWYRETTP